MVFTAMGNKPPTPSKSLLGSTVGLTPLNWICNLGFEFQQLNIKQFLRLRIVIIIKCFPKLVLLGPERKYSG